MFGWSVDDRLDEDAPLRAAMLHEFEVFRGRYDPDGAEDRAILDEVGARIRADLDAGEESLLFQIAESHGWSPEQSVLYFLNRICDYSLVSDRVRDADGRLDPAGTAFARLYHKTLTGLVMVGAYTWSEAELMLSELTDRMERVA